MFGHNRGDLPYDYYTSEFQSQFPLPAAAAPPLFVAIPGEHDSLSALRSEIGYASSGCSSYGGSPTSYSPTLIQRSISSHSLHKNSDVVNSSSPPPYYDGCDATSVRKVLSTGDLQGSQQRSNNSQFMNENTSIIESMSRANPYSPEEKKERIERYRSKRNLRNFNKKIKYECRKTLADSRPRIRGRFARNDEIEKTTTPQAQWENTTTPLDEDDEEDDENWINFLDSFSANLMP